MVFFEETPKTRHNWQMKTPGKTKDFANAGIAASLKPGKKRGFQTRERFSGGDIQETADFTGFFRDVHLAGYRKIRKKPFGASAIRR